MTTRISEIPKLSIAHVMIWTGITAAMISVGKFLMSTGNDTSFSFPAFAQYTVFASIVVGAWFFAVQYAAQSKAERGRIEIAPGHWLLLDSGFASAVSYISFTFLISHGMVGSYFAFSILIGAVSFLLSLWAFRAYRHTNWKWLFVWGMVRAFQPLLGLFAASYFGQSYGYLLQLISLIDVAFVIFAVVDDSQQQRVWNWLHWVAVIWTIASGLIGVMMAVLAAYSR